MKKKRKKNKRNCKDGLTNLQEIAARKIRQELLTEAGREKYFEEIRLIYGEFNEEWKKNKITSNFKLFFEENHPEMHSALKRLNIAIEEILNLNLGRKIEGKKFTDVFCDIVRPLILQGLYEVVMGKYYGRDAFRLSNCFEEITFFENSHNIMQLFNSEKFIQIKNNPALN